LDQADAVVCSNCFRYVGSIEFQLAQRLLKEDESLSEGLQQLKLFSLQLVNHYGVTYIEIVPLMAVKL
jgi:hypothetical protein